MKTMGDECFIKVPVDKLPEAVRKAYELSVPQGLGFLHARQGPLDEETLNDLMDREKNHLTSRYLVSLDYVHGRSCKFRVTKAEEEGFMLIEPRWYDHGDWKLDQLLTSLGIENPEAVRQEAIRNQEAFYAERDKEDA